MWIYGRSNARAAVILLVPCWTLLGWGYWTTANTWTRSQPKIRLSGSDVWLVLFHRWCMWKQIALVKVICKSLWNYVQCLGLRSDLAAFL